VQVVCAGSYNMPGENAALYETLNDAPPNQIEPCYRLPAIPAEPRIALKRGVRGGLFREPAV
jgi:hypothetical protein